MTEYSDCGVIFVATGPRFLREAEQAARSVVNCCPDISTTLFTSLETDSTVFDTIKQISDPTYGFADKVENLRRSPYERSIYLDGDIYVHDSDGLYDIFDMLARFDIVGSHALMRTVDGDGPLGFYQEDIPDSFPLINGGLIGYRNSDEAYATLSNWENKYRRDVEEKSGTDDQPSLRAAIYKGEAQFAALPPEYNFRIPYEQLLIEDVKIFHGRATNMAELAKRVNSAERLEKGRLYVPIYAGVHGPGGQFMHVTPVMNPRKGEVQFRRVIKSIRQHGFGSTLLYLLLGGINPGYTRVHKTKEIFVSEGLVETAKEVGRWVIDRVRRIYSK